MEIIDHSLVRRMAAQKNPKRMHRSCKLKKTKKKELKQYDENTSVKVKLD